MEPNAVVGYGKMRRRELRDNLEIEKVTCLVLPLAMHTPESASPRASRGEEDGVDRISGLPDTILGEIVSFLPTKEGARTQILSKRWRPIWHHAPLCLDLSELPMDFEALTSIMSHIISTHEGPGKLFRVPWYYYHHYHDTVDAWLQSPALNSLQEIHFYDSYIRLPVDTPTAPPPLSTYFFSSCLRVATINNCRIPDDNAELLRFPKLTKLALSFVNISQASLHSLIAGCPALECLLLQCNYFFRSVRISSKSLIGIAVYGNHHSTGLEEIIIEDTPSLRRFFYFQGDRGLRVSIVSAPKLETLGCPLHNDDSSSMVFGSIVIQGLDVISSGTVVSTVKILAVDMHILSLDTIADLMTCFPCLEKLYVEADYSEDTNSYSRKHLDLIQSLDIRIKKVVMFEYEGTMSQVNFAKFFILNAKRLQSMRFIGAPNNDNEVFVASQRRKLQLEERASSLAQFHFTTECYHDISHINDVHALCRPDPFECCYCS